MVEIFQVTLIVATFLCTLVAGFVFAFAVVVMPGIRTLGDGEFLRAFQVMDRVRIVERVDEDEQSVKRFDLFPDISIGDAPVLDGGA